MRVSDKGAAPGEPGTLHPRALTTEEAVIHEESSAPLAHPSTEECFVCYDGLVFIGRLELTEEGEEIEVVVSVPCRRCADSR